MMGKNIILQATLWGRSFYDHTHVRATEDEMIGWHHRFNGHELGQTPGDGEEQGSLACLESQRVGHDLATEQQPR